MKNNRVINIVILIVIILILSFLLFLYWPIMRDRYLSQPEPIKIPNLNIVRVKEEEKISPDSLSRILIPKLGIDGVLIFPPDDFSGDRNKFVEKNLDKGVVFFPNGVTDLKKENIVFFGHSSSIHPQAEYATVFVNLDKLKEGDEIILITKEEKQIKYKVKGEAKIIGSKETEIVNKDKEEGIITLVTCWPPGTTKERIYVVGKIQE